MEWKVQLFKLNFDSREEAAVQDVVRRGWLTMGEKTQQFEESVSRYLGQHSIGIAVANGTAALHMALLALGVGPGDEVIVPALTFVADINVVKMVGATPVVADCSSLDDWNMGAASIERRMTKRTRAVMVVHYAGFPCAMDEVTNLCRERGVCLIEDAAHAIDALYKGRHCGTFGDIGCFSFFANKNLSVGEGGMFVTQQEELAQQGRYLRSHGMSSLTFDRHNGRSVSYDVLQAGLNYRIDELRSAIGLVQIEKLDAANKKRKILWQRYVEELRHLPQVRVPFQALVSCDPAYHIFPILLDKGIDRAAVISGLKQRGIQSSIHYPSFRDFTAYAHAGLAETPIADDISHRELTLPLYPTMTEDELRLVVSSLKESIQ